MLLDAISDRLRRKTLHGIIHLLPSQGRQRAKLFELGAVLAEESSDDGGWNLELKVAEKDLERFLRRENLPAETLKPLYETPAAEAAN